MTFLFDSFPPVEEEIAPKEKSFTPIFSETTVNFRNFFSPSYTFWLGPQMTPAWGCQDSLVRVWGQKQIFKTGEKWFFIIANNIRKFSYPTHFLTSECHIIYTLLKFLWRLRYQFWSSRGFNPRSVVPFCRVTVKTRSLAVNFAAVKRLYSLRVFKISRKSGIKFSRNLSSNLIIRQQFSGKFDIPRRNVSNSWQIIKITTAASRWCLRSTCCPGPVDVADFGADLRWQRVVCIRIALTSSHVILHF